MAKDTRFDMKNFTEVFTNSVAPFYGSDRIVGTSYVVLVETLVESVIRRLVGMKTGIISTAASLALGKPFEGMFYFGDEPPPPATQEYMDSALSGLQTTPGQFVGQYLVSTFSKGFTMPGFDVADMILTAAAKTMSRPLMTFIDKYMPNDLQKQIVVVNRILARQRSIGLKQMFATADDGGARRVDLVGRNPLPASQVRREGFGGFVKGGSGPAQASGVSGRY